MLQGKVKAALRLLSDSTSQGVLSLDEVVGNEGQTVFDTFLAKHPPAQALRENAVVSPSSDIIQPEPCLAVLFDRGNGNSIRCAALRNEGAADPSGVAAGGWHCFCTAFHGASRTLCDAVAKFTRRIATSYVDPAGLAACVACRWIPLNQNPRVRPIGICEVVRRIVGKQG